MAAPSNFIRALVRYAHEQGRSVLVSLATNQFTAIATTGGKQLTGASANGKSFSYAIPAKLDTMELVALAEEALTLFDSLSADGALGVGAYLNMRPPSRTVGLHQGRGGCVFPYGY